MNINLILELEFKAKYNVTNRFNQAKWFLRVPTCFLCLVNDAEAPSTLTTSLDDLDAELVFRIRLEILNVDVQVS